jgi:hypothetical protein
MKDTWRTGLKSLEVERNVANLHHYAERSRHHTKDKQRLVVSVVAYDSLPGHPRSNRHSARSISAFVNGLREFLRRTLGEGIEVQTVGRRPLARRSRWAGRLDLASRSRGLWYCCLRETGAAFGEASE